MLTQSVDGIGVRWVPTAIARKMLGVSKQRVYQLVDQGKLASRHIDGVVMVSVRSIEYRLAGRTVEGVVFDD